MKIKHCGAVLLLAALLCLPIGCKGEEGGEGGPVGIEPPETYTLGVGSIPALALGEEGGILAEGGTQKAVYTYAALPDAGSTAETYVTLLTGEENGFSVVDEGNVRCRAPSFSEAEGTVRLAREVTEEAPEGEEGSEEEAEADAEAEEDAEAEAEAEPEPEPEQAEPEGEAAAGTEAEAVGELITVTLDWSEGQCVVTAASDIGVITNPPPEESQAGAGAQGGFTLLEAVDYLGSLSPADLGLSGSNMSEYAIYANDGSVLVDDTPCIRLVVYSKANPEQTNDPMGSYLLGGNRQIYRLNENTGAVEPVTLSS